MARDDTTRLILLGIAGYLVLRAFSRGSIPLTTTGTSGRLDYSFITGQRYVDFDPATSRYYVYWYGIVTYYGSKTEAEQAYNRLIETRAGVSGGGTSRIV